MIFQLQHFSLSFSSIIGIFQPKGHGWTGELAGEALIKLGCGSE